MKVFSMRGIQFDVFTFEEIEEHPDAIKVDEIKKPSKDIMDIEKLNGFMVRFKRGEYLTVWPDGDILTGVKAYIDESAKLIEERSI